MDPTNLTMAGALTYSLIGFAIVFAVLIVLMIVINVMAAIMKSTRNQAAPAAAAPAPAPAAPAPAAAPAAAVAPGTAGELKLYNVPDKEAALIMAIVASKMNKPLNELRFKSIKEVK